MQCIRISLTQCVRKSKETEKDFQGKYCTCMPQKDKCFCIVCRKCQIIKKNTCKYQTYHIK